MLNSNPLPTKVNINHIYISIKIIFVIDFAQKHRRVQIKVKINLFIEI